MPPKLRRPAAAAGRRAGHRRPATAPEARGAVVWVKSKDLRLEDFATGTNIVVEGEYWEAPVDLCGVVVGALIEGDERYLKVRGGGTHSEAILKFLSGSRGRECQVHLCGDPCEAKVWKDGLVHALRVRKVTGPKEGWMDNLGEVRVEEAEEDQNADLRREAEKARQKLLDREAVQGDGREEKKASKERKKKKKRKKESKKLKASDGRKSLELVFGGTGLDPEPSVRRAAVKRARRLRKESKKKRRRSSSSSTSSTSSSSTSSDGLMIDSEIFEGQKETQRIWRRAPGTLCLSTVLEAQQTLLTRQGIQPEVHKGPLPAIMVQYFRGNLRPIMTPALQRESHHWSMLLDLLVQGEIARGCDLKSLESYARGVTLDITRHLELVPAERASLATATETNLAGKQATEESKLQAKTRYPGKGSEAPPYHSQGKKGKAKGDGKKGRGDGKTQKKGKEDDRDKAS